MSQVDLPKSKTLHRIESKLRELPEDSMRYQVLDACRRFKISWLELGQALFAAQRDKLYRDWGFVTFEGYCVKELGIRQATAFKLLKSYSFLEKEEPRYLQKMTDVQQKGYPELDAVNLLRTAKLNQRIEPKDYVVLRKKVLEDHREATDVRREMRDIVQRSSHTTALGSERKLFLKRLMGLLKRSHMEAQAKRFLPNRILVELDQLSDLVEKEAER